MYRDYACVWCLAPRQVPCSLRATQVLGIARLVGVKRTVQNNSNVKSEPCEESPVCAFYFWILSRSSVALLVSTVDWLFCFLSQSCQPSAALAFVYALRSAKYVHCEGPPLPPLSQHMLCIMHVSDILPGRERKSTLRVWLEIDFQSDTINWYS